MLAAERNASCKPLVGAANATSPPQVPGLVRTGSGEGGGAGVSPSELPDQLVVRAALSTASLVIGALFVVEMLLKLIAGGGRFYADIVEMADCLVVLTVACLGAMLWAHPPLAARGWRLLQLVVLLRLLRCVRLVALLVEVRSRVLSRQLAELQRERQTAENKSEVLILKVEDLEHEVAYLKEKLKKAEREFASSGIIGGGGRKSIGGGGGHRKLRDTFSLTSCCGSAIALAPASASGPPTAVSGSVSGGASIPALYDPSSPHSGAMTAVMAASLDQTALPTRSGICSGRRLSQGLGLGTKPVPFVGTHGSVSHSAHTQTSGHVCEACRIPQTIDFMAARLSYLALKHAISALQVQSTIHHSGVGSGGDDGGRTDASHSTAALSLGAAAATADGTGVSPNTLSARRPPGRLLPVPLSVATPLVSPGLSSLESGYSSCLSSASRHPHLSSASPYGSLGESMPASWSASGCGGSAALCCHSSSRRGSRGTVFLFPDLQRRTDSLESQGTISVELNILDEVAEAELSPAATTLQPPGCPPPPPPPPPPLSACHTTEMGCRQYPHGGQGPAGHREQVPAVPAESGLTGAAADAESQMADPPDHLSRGQSPGSDAAAADAQQPDAGEGSRDANGLHHTNQGTCKIPMTSL